MRAIGESDVRENIEGNASRHYLVRDGHAGVLVSGIHGEDSKTAEPAVESLDRIFLTPLSQSDPFFSGSEERHKRYKGNDLSTFDPMPWGKRQLTKEEIDAIKVPGEKLDQEYSNKISNLLQHCTVVRVEPLQGWEMSKMYGEIEPIMSAFAKSFPRGSVKAEARTDSTANSTATVIVYEGGLSKK
jgi:hypothetical protein